MNILFLTACFGDLYTENYKKFVLPTIREYAKNRNFDFKIVREARENERSPQWQKMIEVKKEIENYDWVVWFDADVMIMNHEVDIRNYFDNDYNLILSPDLDFIKEQNLKYRPNTGFMIWKGKSSKSRKMINKIYHGPNYFTLNPTELFHEQDSIRYYLLNNKNFLKSVKILSNKPMKFWFIGSDSMYIEDILLDMENKFYLFDKYKGDHGSNENWFIELISKDFIFKKGDFIVHFAGIPDYQRNNYYKKFSHHVHWGE